MPLTDAQRKVLLADGLNPDDYEQSTPDQNLTPPVVSTSPKSTTGAFGAGARSFAAGAAPAVVGGYSAGTVAGAVSPWAIAAAPETLGLSLLAIPAAAAIAGYAGGKATSAVQGALIPPTWQQQLAKDQQEHPTATTVGGLATLPLGGLSPSAPNAIKALGTLGKLPANLYKGLPLAASESGNLANVATGAALNPALDLATSKMEGRETPSGGDLAKSALIGALFNKPNSLGIKYGFHPAPENARDMAQVPSASIPDITPPINDQQALSTVGTGVLNTTDVRPIVETRTPTEQDLLTAEQRKITPVRPVVSPESIDATLPKKPSDSNAVIRPEDYDFVRNKEIADQIQDRVNLEDANAQVKEGVPITAGKPEQNVPTPDKKVSQQGDIVQAEEMANNKQLPFATRVAAQEQLNNLRAKQGVTEKITPPAEPLIKPVENTPAVESNPSHNEPSKTTTGVNSMTTPAETSLEKAMNLTSKYQKKKPNELTPEVKKNLRLLNAAIKAAKESPTEQNNAEVDRLISLIPDKDAAKPVEVSNKSTIAERPFTEQSLNSPDSQARLVALAEQHGVKLAKDASIGSDNAGVIFKESAKDAVARLHPDNAGADTPHHEILHALYSYMKNSSKSGFRELASRGEKLFGGEEPFVQASGEDALARFSQDKSRMAKVKEWYKDFKSTWKFALGKASKEDLARLMSHYELHDSGTQQSYGKTPFGGATSKSQPSDNTTDFTTNTEKELKKDRPFGLVVANDGTLPRQSVEAKILKSMSKDELAALNEAGLKDYLNKEGDRTNLKSLKKWIEENGPKVEVKKYEAWQASPSQKEHADLAHNFYDNLRGAARSSVYKALIDAKRGGLENNSDYDYWRKEAISDYKGTEESRKQFIEQMDRYIASGVEVDRQPSSKGKNASFSSVAPKNEKDMNGYVEIAVVKKKKTVEQLINAGKYPEYNAINGGQEPDKFSNPSHQNLGQPNTLGWVRGHMEVNPTTGEKTFLIHEVQSDWAQEIRRRIDAEKNTEGYPYKMATDNQKDPALNHYESLALKAAIKHARQEGATHIAISDGETAMLTEGHDKAVFRNHRRSNQDIIDNTNLSPESSITQAKGMRLHYDQTLPNILEKLTGSKGEVGDFGEHKMAVDRLGTIDRNNAEGYQQWLRNETGPRKDLIFKNPDGTPKTSVTAKVFPLDKIGTRIDSGEPFSTYSSKFQKSDKARYDELISQFKAAANDEPKRLEIQKQIEELKNKNGGMPPVEKTTEPTPGSFQSIKKYGNEEDGLRTIEAVKNGTKPVGLLTGYKMTPRIQEALNKSGLSKDARGFIFRPTDEGIQHLVKISTLDHDYQNGNHNKETFQQEYGKALGFTDKEIAEFMDKSTIGSRFQKKDEAKLSLPWTAEITKIRNSHGEQGAKVADAFTNFFQNFTDLKGHLTNDVVSKLRDHLNFLNPKELATNNNESMKRVVDYLDDKSDGVKPRVTLTPKEEDIVKIVKESNLKSLAEKNKRPELDDTEADPDYFAHVVGRKQLNILLNKPTSPEARQLIKDFYDYQENHLGKTKEEADENLQIFRDGYKGGDKNLAAQFGPIDKSAGVGIPKSWRETNLLDRMARFTNRYARRLAYHDAIETQPDVVNALENPQSGIQSAKEVKHVMDDISGKREFDEAKRDAIGGVIRAGMMGPLTGVKDFATNITLAAQHQDPTQVIPSLGYALKNFKENMVGSFRSGVNVHNIGTLEFGDGGIDNITQVLRRTRDIMNIVQGRTHLEQATRATAWGTGKFLAMDNLIAAKNGKLSPQGEKFLNDFAGKYDWKSYKAKGEFPPDVLDKVAARFVESVQGTYDARGLPAIATKGTLSPILSLARWNIEKFNNFTKYNIEPLKAGNYRPLLMSTLGAVLGGTAVNAIVEAATGKKEKSPEWKEIMNNPDQLKAFAYKAAALASLSGYAGIMGDLSKTAMDYKFKNRPQGYNNPLIDGVNNAIDLTQDLAEAMDAGQLNVGLDTASKILETYFQSYRIALRLASGTKQDEIDLSNKMRDVKMFKNLNNYPVSEPTKDTVNPFMNVDLKKFKKTDNIQEAAGLVPTLVKQAWDKSNGNFALFKSTLEGMKANPYETMPNVDRDPISFMQYRKFILDTQGEEAANKLMRDYYLKNSINKVKAGMIPSL